MKILIISHEYPPIGGGGANACLNLTKEYAKLGHDVHVVTAWYSGQKETETIDDYRGSVTITRLKSKRKHLERSSFTEMFDFMFKAKSFAGTLVKDSRKAGAPFDICQIFFGIPSGPVGLYLKKKYKLPYIIRFGGGDIPGAQDRFAVIYKVISPAVKIIWKNASALVANSQGLKDTACGFCSKYPIEIIPNGVDTTLFYPPQKTDKTEKKDIINLLFVSRLLVGKGLQFVIPYLKRIEDETGKKIHFTIVGDGPYRPTLEQLANENGVESMVSFEGKKNKDELLPYYQAADIFVFPSLHEGMPNAVLEAMACGLPVVMSPCQGSGELINGNGIIADTDLELFYKSIIEIINLPKEKLEEMAEESLELAKDTFSWAGVSGRYEVVFGEASNRL